MHDARNLTRLQVVEQQAVVVIERIGLCAHGLASQGSHECNAAAAQLTDDIRRIKRYGRSCLEEVGTDDGDIQLTEQFVHAGYAVIELVVTQTNGIVVHVAEDVNDVLSLGNGTCRAALQEVATADKSHGLAVVRSEDLADASQTGVVVNVAMHVVFVKHHDRLLLLGNGIQVA